MGDMGKAMMGTGESSGEERAINAAQAALNNPLLDDSNIKGARSILLNIQGGPDMALFEVDEAASKIRNEVDGNANIIFGSSVDEALEGIIKISIVATGMSDTFQERKNEIDEHRDNSKTTHLNDVSFINTADEINIEGNKLHSQNETETENTDQIDIENEINAIEIKNQYEPSQLSSDDILNNTEDNNLKNKDENLNLILETISDKNVSKDKPKNLLKRLSTFFIDEKINETHVHPKVNLEKKIIENKEVQVDEDQIKKTISEDSDLFNIKEQSKFTDHQIDLIDMDQQNQEINEDVLEIPAFLRRQAN
jgi:cell division protein FtsZ